MMTIADASEAPEPKKARGRPKSGKALSASERQKRRRKKMEAEGMTLLPPTKVKKDVAQALEKFIEFKDMTLGDAIDRIVRDRLLRKRSGKRKAPRVTALPDDAKREHEQVRKEPTQ